VTEKQKSLATASGMAASGTLTSCSQAASRVHLPLFIQEASAPSTETFPPPAPRAVGTQPGSALSGKPVSRLVATAGGLRFPRPGRMSPIPGPMATVQATQGGASWLSLCCGHIGMGCGNSRVGSFWMVALGFCLSLMRASRARAQAALLLGCRLRATDRLPQSPHWPCPWSSCGVTCTGVGL
jgi:hypothetical protein